ncbi:hypothetical protein [Streptomyces sp. NPDC058545]|uniref:hypothetical protein n=1 Tax=Streptomyces sp. NPDC058545 TaxID=3346544 RepID=UPI003654DFA9
MASDQDTVGEPMDYPQTVSCGPDRRLPGRCDCRVCFHIHRPPAPAAPAAPAVPSRQSKAQPAKDRTTAPPQATFTAPHGLPVTVKEIGPAEEPGDLQVVTLFNQASEQAFVEFPGKSFCSNPLTVRAPWSEVAASQPSLRLGRPFCQVVVLGNGTMLSEVGPCSAGLSLA